MAQTDVDYRRPILLRAEPYDCWSGVLRVGTSSLTLGQEIRDGDEVFSRARVTSGLVRPGIGRSCSAPGACARPGARRDGLNGGGPTYSSVLIIDWAAYVT